MKRTGERWYPGETISVSIGQGQVSVTPAAMAVMISTVANGGTRVTPHVIKAIDEGSGWTPTPVPAVADKCRLQARHAGGALATASGWWSTAAGTGGRARVPGRDVSGKTGTAQVISNEGRARARGTDRDLRDHGWFVVLRAARQSRDRRLCSSGTQRARATSAPRSRSTSSRRTSRRRRTAASAAAGAEAADGNDEDPDSPPALPPVVVADNQALPPAGRAGKRDA